MKRGDIALIALVLIVMAVMAVPKWLQSAESSPAVYAVIKVNGEHYDTVALTGDAREIEIKTNRGYNKLLVSNGGIAMIEADCPDRLCIGFGQIREIRDTIVCLPNRIIVELTGTGDGGETIDALAS